MALGLDDALLGWLVAKSGDTALRRVQTGPVETAMREIVEIAIDTAVAVAAAHLDSEQGTHLRCVLSTREIGLEDGQLQVGSRAELEAALRAWTAALDYPEYGEPGYLSQRGVSPRLLADHLIEHITGGITRNARAGGPLKQLAEWLWRDELSAEVGRLRQDLSQLRRVAVPASSYRGGLPGGVPDFTGREKELAVLAEGVGAHDPTGVVVAILAVYGMAGVGKTELALRVAHQHKHRYPDGHYFINLHGYTEGIAAMPSGTALEVLLRQAGVPGQEIPADLHGRQDRWQALMATRRALVLLDNALDAAQVRPLLPNSAGCLVLVTSRSRLLGLPGARAFPLDVLTPSEAIELFNSVAGTDQSRDRRALTRVVEMVGRLPVAVRSVAGQVDRDYTETELADDLAQAKSRTGLAATTGLLGAEVGVAFETSLQRLDQPHRHAFWILGTHPGPVVGVPQFAALADLPPPKARAVLRRLAGGNLITPAGQRVGHVRYELHDLLREYARQQAQTHLPALQRSAALARLTSWYTTVMGAIDGLIEAPEGVPITEPVVEGLSLAGPGEVRAWLAAEQDNLLAVAEHATGEDAARVYCEYAWPLYRSDYHATARTLFRAAAGIYRQIGDRDGRAHSLTGLGYVALATSDFPGAAEHFDAALATYQQIGDPRGQAYVLTGLGRVALATGDYPGAAEQYGAALDIFRQVAEPAWQANSLAGLGRVALATGDYPGAAEQYEAALATYRQIGDLSGQAYALVGLGHVALATGDYPGAAGRYEAALGIYRQVGGRAWQADALTGLGRIALATGDYPGSAGHFEAALGICRQVGDRRGQADALAGLGRVTTADGRRDEARQRLSEALVIYVEIGSPLAGDVREDLDRLGRD